MPLLWSISFGLCVITAVSALEKQPNIARVTFPFSIITYVLGYSLEEDKKRSAREKNIKEFN